MHQWLLEYSSKDEYQRGEYKKIPIRIEAFDNNGRNIGAIFETTSPMLTPIQMTEFIHWTQKALNDKQHHSLIVIGLFTLIFSGKLYIQSRCLKLYSSQFVKSNRGL